MADTSTDAVAPDSVWVQLYWDNNEESGEPFEIEPIPKNVGALKKDVIKEYRNTLSHADAAFLKVYAPGTTVPIPNITHSLTPGEKVVKYSTTDEKPIIVIAPKPQQQQQQQQHTVPVACYPPSTPTNRTISSLEALPRLPDSPPRNGIYRAGFLLLREELVSKIIERAKPIMIIHSAPATGKTSLLDLTQKFLEQEDNTSVLRFNTFTADAVVLITALKGLLGVPLHEIESISRNTWILIDDAQLAFTAAAFWISKPRARNSSMS